MASSIYTELDLQTRSIRLLKFEEILSDGSLVFTLETARLDQHPYVALSYTWDSLASSERGKWFEQALCWDKHPADQAIIVNNNVFNITPNLHSFLQVIAPSRPRGTWFYVDQICINQIDQGEKAQQVGLMGKIYSQANEVIAWVNPLADVQMEAPRVLHKYDDIKVFLEDPQSPNFDEERRKALSKGADLIAEHFVYTLASAYWSRQWIVQEVMLAKSLTLQFGEYGLDWIFFLKFVSRSPIYADIEQILERDKQRIGNVFQYNSELESDARFQGATVIFFRGISTLAYKHQGRFKFSQTHLPGQGISDVLLSLGGRDCAKRRDGIFALLGLANTEIKADYRTPIVVLYLQVIIDALQHDNTVPDVYLSRVNNTILAVLKILGLPYCHPVVLLVTKELLAYYQPAEHLEEGWISSGWITFLWQQHEYGAVNKAMGLLTRPVVAIRYRKMKSYLQRARLSNQQMDAPDFDDQIGCDTTITKSYSEWVQLVADLVPANAVKMPCPCSS